MEETWARNDSVHPSSFLPYFSSSGLSLTNLDQMLCVSTRPGLFLGNIFPVCNLGHRHHYSWALKTQKELKAETTPTLPAQCLALGDLLLVHTHHSDYPLTISLHSSWLTMAKAHKRAALQAMRPTKGCLSLHRALCIAPGHDGGHGPGGLLHG